MLLTIAVYSCGRRITTRAQRVARRRAGHHQRIGPLGHGPGQRRRPVARAVGARGRVRTPLPRRPASAHAVWVGLAAGARGVDQGAVGAGGRHRRADRAALAPTSATGRPDAAVAAGIAVAVYLVAALPFGLDRVWDQSFAYHQDARRAEHALRARSARSSTRCGTAISSSLLALALAAMHVRVRFVARRRVPGAGRPGAHDRGRRPRALGRAGGRRCSCGSRRCGGPTSPTWCRRSPCSPRCGRHRGRCCWSRRRGRAVLSCRNNRSILWPDGLLRRRGRAGAAPRALPADALVISDDPGLVWRSGHPPPGATRRPVVPAHRPGPHHPGIAGAGGGGRRRVRRDRRRRPQHFGRFDGLGDALAAEGYRSDAVRSRITAVLATAATCRSVIPWSSRRRRRCVQLRPSAVEPAQRRHRVDDPAERHQLGGDVEREQHEHHRRGAMPSLEPSTTASPSTAPITFAPVSPSISRSRRSSPSSPNAAPITGAMAMPMGAVPIDDRDRHVGDEPELDRAARRAVEQVAEVGGERDEHGVDDERASRLEARGRRRARPRPPRPPTSLSSPVVTRPLAERAEVALEPAVLTRPRSRSSIRPRKPNPNTANSTARRAWREPGLGRRPRAHRAPTGRRRSPAPRG